MMSIRWLYFNQRTLLSSKTKFRGGTTPCVPALDGDADAGERADTRQIQAILVHEKLETTQIYTQVAIGHLKKVHEKTHPAERKQKQRRKRATQADPDKNEKNEYD